ncbi:SGNH/GDSL hydrolase family protein [Stackebrandtia nassauensis]|uniref:Triacylglycerol lipase n=1 Tax=Stackebrandtia nassauensis (strain DSM 44728 / CIP 108903 / NRRL B-16338 / NBRC 102104 / LLR-40K-21) TaxID=446470 RepID=D3Q6I6_STANL|nr:SGNH/GDSL hydrolase family protein [Stackebrandtia nassauensis]ADD44229.1 Triacylglycerol lipase [Stackebrandtia nassauensis DSM 44728]
MRKLVRLMLVVAASGLAVAATAVPSQAYATNYTALGDSYASGTGTREYFDEGCQKSKHAYPEQLAAEKGYTLTFAACSGAKIGDVQNQLGSLNGDTGLVTVSAGGNDTGWTDVVVQCALPGVNCQDDVERAEAFIRDELPGKLDGLYGAIRAAAPNAKVVVVTYPLLFNGEDCNAGTFFSGAEMESMNRAAGLLDDTTATVAGNHGFSVVDPRGSFTGHAVCDDEEWLNGLSNPVGESYHPNQAGHDAFTRDIGAQV